MKLKLIIFTFFIVSFAYSQTDLKEFCITPNNSQTLRDYSERINKIRNLRALENQPQCLNKKLSVHVHLIGENDSSGFADISTIIDNIDSLNKAFEPVCLEFEICKTDSIYNSIYYNLAEADYQSIQELYSDSGVINMFFVSSLGTAGGTATPPTVSGIDDDLFAISNIDSKVIIQTMGYYLGVVATHESINEAELVDGSNCSTAGDLLCDTEASPNLSSVVGADCSYDFSLTDANGDNYTPPLFNYMSFSHPACRKQFTPQQFKVMIFSLLNLRDDLH